jgi:hypothetical protein
MSGASVPLSSFVTLLLLNHDARRTWVACFAYFDVSGSRYEPLKTRRAMAIGGFVSTEAYWKRFERRWDALLKSEGLQYFQMKEFAHSVGQFRDWKGDEPRRREFLKKAIKVIKHGVLKGFVVAVDLDLYEQFDTQYELHEHIAKPYGLIAGMAMGETITWFRKTHPTETLLFAFEKGDLDQNELERVAPWQYPHPPMILPAVYQDEVTGQTVYRRPFEAGDFLAYEAQRSVPLVDTGTATRQSFGELAKQVPHLYTFATKNALQRICVDVPRRRSRDV